MSSVAAGIFVCYIVDRVLTHRETMATLGRPDPQWTEETTTEEPDDAE